MRELSFVYGHKSGFWFDQFLLILSCGSVIWSIFSKDVVFGIGGVFIILFLILLRLETVIWSIQGNIRLSNDKLNEDD